MMLRTTPHNAPSTFNWDSQDLLCPTPEISPSVDHVWFPLGIVVIILFQCMGALFNPVVIRVGG